MCEKMKFLKWLCEFAIISVIMFGFAYLFLKAWDSTEFVDQARRAARMDTMLYPDPPVTPSAPPSPNDLATPKTRVFQDASQRKGK
jgi:hypothetical protein